MKRTRWKVRLVGGLLGLAALGGCKQTLWVEPADYQDAISNVKMARLETHPDDPIVTPPHVGAAPPATVVDLSRPLRPMNLKEAIAIALEQGTVGSGTGSSDRLPNFNFGFQGTDAIGVFALNPAQAGAEVERALSKFDARWITSMTWNKRDEPTLTLQQSFSNGDSATLQSTLAKPLPTGGVAGITFSTNYQSLSSPPPPNTNFVTLSTSYTPRLQFVFEQPLLQGFGVMINQLLPNHPGSQLLQLRPSGGQGSSGILISRIRHDQQNAAFEVQVNQMLLSVESAYWNLFSAYYNLRAQEEGLKRSLENALILEKRANVGAIRSQQADQAWAQYWGFLDQVIQARGGVLNAERQLRNLLGMTNDDGFHIIPIDEPTIVSYLPDPGEITNQALQNKPELAIARQELKSRQLELLTQKNLRRPDLRFFSSYDIAGLGPRLDGSDINTNALRSFSANTFNSWQIGLRLDMPIGFRDANALVRQAQMRLRQGAIELEQAEKTTLHLLDERYRQVIQAHHQIGPRKLRRDRLAAAILKDRNIRDEGAIGTTPDQAVAFISNLLNQESQLAEAESLVAQAVANYNVALAALEHAKGTIQQYNNVAIADGPLPPHVDKRASDHFRAREAAIKVREQPDVTDCGPGLDGWKPMSIEQLNAVPPPPPGTVVPNLNTATPWDTRNAPNPLPLNPAETAPPPTPRAPSQPGTSIPMTGSSNLPTSMDDLPATFRPIDRVILPKRPTGKPVAEAPPSTTPVPSGPSVPGTGLPISRSPGR